MTISIKPTASGSTIEQDGSTILTVDGSGNLTVANNLSVTGTAPIPDALSTASGSAPSYSARAWVNFNGTGTVAIRGSGNVSSITDNGTGVYAVNLTTAMPDTNYSVSGACANQTTPTTERDREFQAVASSTSVVNINIYVQTDMAYISLQVFR